MRRCVIITLAIGLALTNKAQQTLQVGVLGGPQSVWLINKNDTNDPHKRYANAWRGFVGADIDFHFTPLLGAGLELVYSMQGQNYLVGRSPSAIDTLPYSNKVNYFKVPLLFIFNSNPENPVMFLGKFGPVFGFTTSAYVSNANSASPGGDGSSPPWNQPDGENIKSQFQPVSVGMILGLGMAININRALMITAGIRLDGTLTNTLINTPEPSIFSNYDGPRSKTWEVAGGIEFGVKYTMPVVKK